jgi:Asp-tRNA(Asn)/Glu-tRNA(Gln) amidotransferase C subunit
MREEAEGEMRLQLSRVIQSVEQIDAMGIEELESLLAEHEREIVSLVGAIDSRRVDNPVAARQAERILRLHKSWVERALSRLRLKQEKEARKLEKQSKTEAHRQLLEKAQAEKAARIAASNDENMRQIAVFKAVALEVLGAEKYLELWNQVRQRMAEPQQQPYPLGGWPAGDAARQ